MNNGMIFSSYMDDVVASNPKANMTYDVINTCVEFKISKPQAYGFTII
jgi:hypothetical protein